MVAILVTHLDVFLPRVAVKDYYAHRAVEERINCIARMMNTPQEWVLPVVNMTEGRLDETEIHIMALDAFSKMIDIAVNYIKTCQNVRRPTTSDAQATRT